MTRERDGRALENYEIETRAGSGLTEVEHARCIAIIMEGGAVDAEVAADELPLAALLGIALKGKEIGGLGVIKRVRPYYAMARAKLSGATFDSNTPELGYVAIDRNHRNRGLSGRIVTALIAKCEGRLFATTDDQYMKKTLAKAGFVQRGHEWDGRRGRLSLWIRPHQM